MAQAKASLGKLFQRGQLTSCLHFPTPSRLPDRQRSMYAIASRIVLIPMDAFVTHFHRSDTSDESCRSASHRDSAGERAPKRVKRDEIKNPGPDFPDSEESDHGNESQKKTNRGSHHSEDADTSYLHEATAFENVLPPTQTDADAIEEYEQTRSSQKEADNDGTTENTKSLWIKGRSSIYVDAFNLALDTVLEEESELFDEKEIEVFRRWKVLSYEAQYL